MTNDKLEELYKKYHRFVKDIAYKTLEDPYLAQDVCHDVFLRLSDEWIEADIVPEVRREYLRVAAYHRAMDYLYQKWADAKMMSYDNLKTDEERIRYLLDDFKMDEMVMKRIMLHQIFIDLKKQNENWYMVILRKEIYHEPVALIAQELNIKTPLVHLWLYRAKAWIKENYGEEFKSYL